MYSLLLSDRYKPIISQLDNKFPPVLQSDFLFPCSPILILSLSQVNSLHVNTSYFSDTLIFLSNLYLVYPVLY